MPPPELISVVVTTYNRSDALVVVLRALAAQTDGAFEVVVADDGSSVLHRQAVRSAAAALPLRSCWVWHPDLGFTAGMARNRGVEFSRGDYLVFLDGDCVPETDFIARHRALAQAGCLVNGSRVLLSAALTRQALAGQVSLWGQGAAFWLGQRLRAQTNKWLPGLRAPDGRWRAQPNFSFKGIRSCNLGVWRSDFARVDGFDESFVGWGHEDADLVLRLFHAGVQRKSGVWATEVAHLWHPEAARTHESANWRTVLARQRSGQIRADLGFSRGREADPIEVERL